MLPRVFALYLEDNRVWEYSLWISVFLLTLAGYLEGKAQLSMDKAEAGKIHVGWHVGAWGLATCSVIAVVGGLINPQFAAQNYVTGVFFSVLVSLFVFTGLIFRRFF